MEVAPGSVTTTLHITSPEENLNQIVISNICIKYLVSDKFIYNLEIISYIIYFK